MTTTATSVHTHLAEDILPGHPDRIADEIASVVEGGDGLLRQRLASLGLDERRALRGALAEPEFV